MVEEQLKAFLEKVKSDTELQESSPFPGELTATAFSITAEDIQTMQSESGEVLQFHLIWPASNSCPPVAACLDSTAGLLPLSLKARSLLQWSH